LVSNEAISGDYVEIRSHANSREDKQLIRGSTIVPCGHRKGHRVEAVQIAGRVVLIAVFFYVGWTLMLL
jgi:hypothetical protein